MSASWINKLNESDSRLHKEDVLRQALEASVLGSAFDHDAIYHVVGGAIRDDCASLHHAVNDIDPAAAVGPAQFHRTEFLQIPRQGRLGYIDALIGQHRAVAVADRLSVREGLVVEAEMQAPCLRSADMREALAKTGSEPIGDAAWAALALQATRRMLHDD